MKKSKLTPLAAAGIALAMLLAAGCGSGDGASAAKNAAKKDQQAQRKEAGQHSEDFIKLSDEERARAGLKTEILQAQQLADTLEVTATVGPDRERIASVLPRVPGRIASIGVKLGDRVKPGQTLAVLDSIEVGESYSAYA